METGAKALEWLRNAVLGVFVAALLAGMFLPVYTDEIGWRLQSRAAFDGVDKLYTELCGPNTLAHPPFWMMPARYYSALFNSLFAAPIYVRLSGILYALVLVGMMLALIRRVAGDTQRRTALSMLALGFISLGTMPLLLVLSRPEQPIVLAFTAAMLIALDGWKQAGAATSIGAAWRRSLVILLLALFAMSYHVKAVALAPLFLTCLVLASPGRAAVPPRVLTAILLAAASIWAAKYWIHRFECPGDALVRADFLRSAGAAMVTAESPTQILPLLTRLLVNASLLLYPGTPAPRPNPMALWLPPNRIIFEDSFRWFLAMISLWTIAFAAAGWCLFRTAQHAWRERAIDSRAVLAIVLVVTVLGWSGFGFTGVYEATFALPMLIFAIVLALSLDDWSDRFAKAVQTGAVVVGLAGIVSVALVATIYAPPFAAAARQPGYVGDQPYSISVFGYDRLRRDILAVARKCGLDNAARHSRVAIDDLTYFPFMQSRLPQHRGGLFVPALTQNPMDYLRSIRSDGVVASCHVLPPAVRARAKSEGSFCCVAPADF